MGITLKLKTGKDGGSQANLQFLDFLQPNIGDAMKRSYGPVPKARTWRILEALLSFASDSSSQRVCFRQFGRRVVVRKGMQPNHIFVRATPQALAELTNSYENYCQKNYLGRIETWHVVEALAHLEQTLGILGDRRQKRQGSRSRYFRLELWHPLADVRRNLEELARCWPQKASQLVSLPTLISNDHPEDLYQNPQLVQLVGAASHPITCQEFARAIGLVDGSESQIKQLLAKTCLALLENPSPSWESYLYRFAPEHLLAAKAEAELVELLPRFPQIQRASVELIVNQFVCSHSWPEGGINGFLLELAYRDEPIALKTLIEIALRLIQCGQEKFASQIGELLPDTNSYKTLVQQLLEVQRRVTDGLPEEVVQLVGQLLHQRGLHPYLRGKTIGLLCQGLLMQGKNHLVRRICERMAQQIFPDNDFETWLTLQFTLCRLEILSGQPESAAARMIPLEKIVAAQHSSYYQEKLGQIKTEGCFRD